MFISVLRGQVPRKQGLKLFSLGLQAVAAPLRGQVPRKQGLKPRVFRWVAGLLHLRGQVPRKQGLKHCSSCSNVSVAAPSRASSKKTRIETQLPAQVKLGFTDFEGKFQENKDWNTSTKRGMSCSASFEGKFQENKDWNLLSIHRYRGREGLRGQVPRKQGLKPDLKFKNDIDMSPSRASSKKTRIETWVFMGGHTLQLVLRGQVPRKQGLKPIEWGCREVEHLPSRASSKKTRIETYNDFSKSSIR